MHGDECPCLECDAKRQRHEDAVAEMRSSCPGCRVGQPYDKSNGYHTETADLYDIKCQAAGVRQRIDAEMASGQMLTRHSVVCDCSMCLTRRRAMYPR